MTKVIRICEGRYNTLAVAVSFFFYLSFLFGLCSTAQAENAPYLVKDINLSQSQSNSSPRDFIASGGTIFFTANNGVSSSQSSQLWKTDGTPEGTMQVKDIYPGGEPNISNMTDVNGTLFFTATSGPANGYSLWKSNGTAEGTVIVKNLSASSLVNLNGTLYFSADDPVLGAGLWKSNGTTEGTIMIKRPSFYDYPLESLINVNGFLFFTAYDDVHGNELWKSDGTPEGTVLVKDIDPINSSYPQYLTDVNGVLYFSALDSEYGAGLWKSDGTPEGTVLVKNLSPLYLSDVNGTVFFVVNSYGVNQLWKSDGTPAGTILLKDFFATGYIYIQDLTAVDGVLFFTALGGSPGFELWKSDGTPAGTVSVKAVAPGTTPIIQYLTNVNGMLYFTSGEVWGSELWKSDGSPAGTVLVKRTNLGGNSLISNVSNIGGTLFFSADDGLHGVELWKSDGSPSGTELVKDINTTNSGSSITWLTEVNDTLFFVADDGVHGRELWRSDGTDEGTSMVKEINVPGDFRYPGNLNKVGGRLLFTATDGLYTGELWVSDGTPEGTEMLKGFSPVDPFVLDPFIGYFVAANNTLFFSADDGVHGMELWKSDGTRAGTVLVKDINPGGHSWPIYLTVVNNSVFFIPSGYNSYSLWKSDGTENGTILLKDFSSTMSNLSNLEDMNGTLLFNRWTLGDNELWKSDGTPEGTLMVGRFETCNGSFPYNHTYVNTTFFYFASTDTCEQGLWKSDGTPPGTMLVKNLSQAGAHNPSQSTAFKDLLLFIATPGQGNDLWRSDGTSEGTFKLKTGIGEIKGPTILYDTLYFLNTYSSAAGCPVLTTQLWKSDGTVDGTVMISSYCNDGFDELASSGARLFFTASDPMHGQELWAYDPGTYHTLTVEKQGTGSGTITSAPGGISCGVHCSEWYTEGRMVTLTAVPSAGSVFTGWSGCAADESNPLRCTVTMASARICTATFDACTYSFSQDLAGFDVSGGSGTFGVTTQTGCAWTAVSGDPYWVSVTAGASGNGSGELAYEVTANPNVAMRSTVISVGDKAFTVTQNGISTPTAYFSASQQSGEAPLYVEFSDVSSNNPALWLWDFGDGGTSVQKNPGHTYRAAGTYTVSLTVINSSGFDTRAVANYIDVTDCAHLPVRIGTNYFQNVSDAYGSPYLIDGTTVELQAREFTANLTHDQEMTVTLKGGYNCGYTQIIPDTVLKGRLNILRGTVVIEGVVVR